MAVPGETFSLARPIAEPQLHRTMFKENFPQARLPPQPRSKRPLESGLLELVEHADYCILHCEAKLAALG